MLGLRALALALLGTSGAGCTLLLGFDDSVIDAAGADGPAEPDAMSIDAMLDMYEPNGTPATATAIDPGSYESLTIAPAQDVDYYSFTTPGAADVTVTLTFEHVLADIDLRLYNSSSSLAIATSATSNDSETIALTGAEQPVAGTYYINVYSARGSSSYQMVLDVVGGPPPPDGGIDGP